MSSYYLFSLIYVILIIIAVISIFINPNKKILNKNVEKNYALIVSNHDEGGVSSHYYGWSTNESVFMFTKEEAEEKKEKLSSFFDEIEIVDKRKCEKVL